MAVRLIKVGNGFNTPVKTYVCDPDIGTDDIQNPHFGDKAIVPDDATYIYGTDGWQQFAEAGGGGDASAIAAPYDETQSYNKGDMVSVGNIVYAAKEAIAANTEWDPEKWETVLVIDLLKKKADLVDGKVPSSQLPSYVDDVVEGYYSNEKFYSDIELTNEITGESSKIYVSIENGYTYRWNNTTSRYVLIGTQDQVYAGDAEPTGDENVWIKTAKYSSDPVVKTASDLSVGDIVYLKETVDGDGYAQKFAVYTKTDSEITFIMIGRSHTNLTNKEQVYEQKDEFEATIKQNYNITGATYKILQYSDIGTYDTETSGNPYILNDIMINFMHEYLNSTIATVDWGTVAENIGGNGIPIIFYRDENYYYMQQYKQSGTSGRATDSIISKGTYFLTITLPISTSINDFTDSYKEYDGYSINLKDGTSWNTICEVIDKNSIISLKDEDTKIWGSISTLQSDKLDKTALDGGDSGEVLTKTDTGYSWVELPATSLTADEIDAILNLLGGES